VAGNHRLVAVHAGQPADRDGLRLEQADPAAIAPTPAFPAAARHEARVTAAATEIRLSP
jgi:hypothetical protein